MYLLSPEGGTLFFIPGVEVVHKAPAPILFPPEEVKVRSGKPSVAFTSQV